MIWFHHKIRKDRSQRKPEHVGFFRRCLAGIGIEVFEQFIIRVEIEFGEVRRRGYVVGRTSFRDLA